MHRAARRASFVAMLALAGLLAAGTVSAQTVRPEFYITNGQVTTEVQLGNTLYVGGSFSYVGPVTGAGVPVDPTTGVPAPGFPIVNGAVLAVVSDGAGGWFIGGQFNTVGTTPRANLAHILADHSVSSWNPGANGIVRTLLLSAGVLYVGGDFLTLGATARNRIGAVDAATGVVSSWNPNANSSVRALADDGSSLYVGGQFTTIGGQARNRIARLSYSTGDADPAWNPNSNGVVLALLHDSGTGLLYVGGQFTGIDGLTRNRIAALDAATGSATTWNPSANNQVLTLALDGGAVYAGGQFTSIGGQFRNRIAALSPSTGLATSWNPNAGNIVQALIAQSGTVYAAGDFLTIGGENRSRVAALDAVSGLATSWNPSAFSTASCLASDGAAIFVGGAFNGIGGVARNNLAAFDVVSGLPTTWNPDANNQVQTMVLTSDGMFIGGNFSQVGGQIRNNIAELDLTNGLATPWDPNADGQVSAIAVTDHKVYAGGLFAIIGGQSRANLAALDRATGLALPWIADTDNQVFSLDASTATIYVGGSFVSVNGTPRNFVAALDSASAAVLPWDPNLNGTVRAIVPTCTQIYLGGFFTTLGGQQRNRLASVDPVTAVPFAWDPNANGPIFVLTRAPGTVYVGGVISTVGGQTRNRIAAVDPETGAVSAWDPNSNGTVRAILADGSQVYIGGAFTSVKGVPTGNLAVATPDPAAICTPFTLTPPPLPDGVEGTPYSTTIGVTGGTAPYCWAVSAGALPAGFALDVSSGQLSGTPTSAGVFAFDLTATDARGCTGSASYTVTITTAPAMDTVAADGSELCLNTAQTCVDLPFVLTRGDSVALRAVSVTIQLDTTRLALCQPGPAATNFTLGDWGQSYPNRHLQVTDLGNGRFTVDVVLLGGACGATTGGTLFTASLKAVGPTGPASVIVESVVARDCSNSPVAAAPGATGSVGVSGDPMVLAPASLPDGTTGTPFSQDFSVSGGLGPFSFSVTAGSLPPGLGLSPTGTLSGTPGAAGTFGFTVTASEPTGCSVSQAYSLTMDCPTLAVQPVFLPDAAVGVAYDATLLSTGGVAPLTFTVTGGGLPDGLTLSPSGSLSGTPTTAGASVFTIAVTDAAGCTASRNYTFDVFATPPVSNVAAQTGGLAISSAHPCVAVPVVYTRGEASPVRGLTVSFQIDPLLLTLCSSPNVSIQPGNWFTGYSNVLMQVTDEGAGAYTVDLALLGAPCGITTGGTLFTVNLQGAGPDGFGSVAVTRVKARDCGNAPVGVIAGAGALLRVQNTDLALSPPTLPNADVGAAYSQAITAASGVPPLTFSAPVDSLPPGLSLAADGTLSGTPTTTGSYAFTVTVADADSVPGARPYTMSVTCPVIAITPTTLPDAQQDVAYDQTISAGGGNAPYVFTVAAGSLPDGLTLSPTGQLSGTPTTPGVSVLTIRATDSFGCYGEETYTLPVFVDPAISRVLAVTAGLCLSDASPCVSVPFVYQKGDSAAAIGAHVRFQVDSRFQLCTPGNPSLSIHPGNWSSGYPNLNFQVIDEGGGAFSVDQVLLGPPCGPTTGGTLFTVDLSAVGGDGAGDLTVTDVSIRDCSNAPLPGQPGDPAQLIVSHTPPSALSDLVSTQILSENGAGPLTRIQIDWTPPAEGTVSLYRADFGGYPEYDDLGGSLPDSTLAPGAPWQLVSANAAPGLLDVPPGRGFWYYVAFVTDSCGNVSAVSNLTKGSLDYHLGDVSDGLTRGSGDSHVALEDVSLLGAHYGISGATLASDSVTYLDVGPTADGTPLGRPSTDDSVDFEDLMIFSLNFDVVSAPQASIRPSPSAPGSGERFELHSPSLVTAGDEFLVTLDVAASGAMQGFSVGLGWDVGVAQPVDVASAGFLERQGGVLFSPAPGRADGALLGRRGSGIGGAGPIATFRFRALRDGDPALKVASVTARDAENRTLAPEGLAKAVVASLPTRTIMLSPAPNPAQGAATLSFALAQAGDAELSIYGVDGRRVRTLARGRRDAGVYRLPWRGEDDGGRPQAPGVYWARLTTAGLTFNRRIVFLR